MSAAEESRVLIIAPLRHDGEAMAAMLSQQEIRSEICADPANCLRLMEIGAGALLLTEEVLEMPTIDELLTQLRSQPAWSELPLIILTRGGESRLLGLLEVATAAAGSVIVLERPMRPATLLRSVQAALRTRRRQYQVRDLMAEQERQRLELRESAERYERQVRLFDGVASTTPDFVYLFDLQGRFRYANRRLLEVWGMELRDVIGKTCRELGYEQWHHDMHMREIAQVIQGKRAIMGEVPFTASRTGIFGVYEYIFTPVLGPDGEVELIAGTTRDVTLRKKAEEVLARDKEELERLVTERTAKLQELVGELEHFSYSITHDMRAPLRAMMAFAHVLEEMCAGSPNQEQKDLVRRIGVAAKRMDLLITDALSYSKAIRSELPLAPVDVGRLLRGMVDTYPELQEARRTISVQRDLPLVMANEAGLTQCFSNLLGNAVKFAKPGESPEIRVRAEVLADRHPAEGSRSVGDGEWVRIWVEDKGIGISKAMLPKIFNMFARGGTEQSGTGIGLALVRKVVDRMGGRVGVESEKSKGSRFWVELKQGDVRHYGMKSAE